MLLHFEQHYRKYGIRKISNFLEPVILNAKEFIFPLDTIFHWSKVSDLTVNPTKEYAYFDKIPGKLFVDTILTYPEIPLLGHFRHLNLTPLSVITEISKNEKIFKFIKPNVKTVPMLSRDLLVINYGSLNHMYKYVINPLAEYYKYSNVMETVIANTSGNKYVTDRNVFILLDLPPSLPSRQQFDRAAANLSRSSLNIFTDYRYMNVLELWKYLTPELKESSIFSKIDNGMLDKVTLLLNLDNKLVMVNLNVLSSIVAEYTTETRLGKLAKYKAATVRKLLYVMLFRTLNGKSESLDTIANDKDDKDIAIKLSDVTATGKTELTDKTTVVGDTTTVVDIDSVLDKNIPEKNDDVVESNDLADDDMDTEPEVVKTTSSELNDIIENIAPAPTVSTITALYSEKIDPINKLSTEISVLGESGYMSKKESARLQSIITTQNEAKSPYENDDITLGGLLDTSKDNYAVSKQDTKIEDNAVVFDKEYNTNTVVNIDKKYIKEQLHKDIVRTFQAVQNTGNIIEEHTVVEEESVLGGTETHTVKMTSLNGKPSTIKVILPKVNEDGTFKLAGNTYTMRKMRADLPIRKIDRGTVALSSQYGKLFVTNATFKKDDIGYWFRKQLIAKYEVDNKLKDIVMLTIENIDAVLPEDYNIISRYIKAFRYGNISFSFDYYNRKKMIKDLTDDMLKGIEDNGTVMVGTVGTTPVVMDMNSKLYRYEGKKYHEIDDIFKMLNIHKDSGPIEYANVRIYKEQFPVGFLLAYYIGFDNLIHLLKPEFRIVPMSVRTTIAANEYVVTFKDYKYIFEKTHKQADMVFYGLSTMNTTLVSVPKDTLNTRSKFANIFNLMKLSILYINEIKLLEEMFIDPTTMTILEQLKQPVNFKGMLLKAVDLLSDDNYNNPNNITEMSIKGYERISAILYSELVNSIKEHRNRSFFSRSKMTVYPYAVVNKIDQDSTTVMVDDLNPITIVKQAETITYLGHGGRSKEGMSRDTREMHSSEIGLVSESSPDSGDVGISAYMSANPNLSNTRGIVGNFDIDANGFSSILSTSSMLAPFAITEDVKRLNFVNIQNSHTIPMINMRAPFVRTGYEAILPIKAAGKYVKIARTDGIVTKVTKSEIVVMYSDKKQERIKLSSWTTKEESGSCYTHYMTTSLIVGDTVVKDDTLAYATSFFEPDVFNRKRVIYKSGIYVNVALMEDIQTFEDSAAISKRMNQEMAATVTKVKSIIVSNTDNIIGIKPKGTLLEPSDVLFTITDGISINGKELDERALAILQNLKNVSPKAKLRGTISKIVVYYNCELDTMSKSLQDLIALTDEDLKHDVGQTGRVNSTYRVNGTSLLPDQVEIKIYIQVLDTMGIGDKAILGNQLKFTVGEVYEYDMKTMDNKEIDLVFSNTSIKARIVNSPDLIGTTSTLLSVITDKALDMYFGDVATEGLKEVDKTSKDVISKRVKSLLDELKTFCSEHDVPKNSIVLFGSIVLGIHGLRYPNDLDIGIKKDVFEKIQKELNKPNCKPGSECAQLDIGNLSFIHEIAVPNVNDKSLFSIDGTTIDGFKVITFDQWKEMQKKDPLKKDAKFL